MTLNYDERITSFKSDFWVGDTSIQPVDKVRFICLLCYLTQKLREKTKDTKVIEVVEKTIPDYKSLTNDTYYKKFIQNMAIICESLLDESEDEVKLFPTSGLKTPKEIVDEMRKILSFYLPF